MFLRRRLTHKPKAGHPNSAFEKVNFSSVYVGPESGEPRSVPLLIIPHGGPHAVMPASFSREVNFFNRMGYAVLGINYRGSLGLGQDTVDCLLGHIGDIDVKDCCQAMEECLQVTFILFFTNY